MHESIECAESGLYTGPAYRLIREDAEHPLILVCEHADRFIPAALNDLGLDETAAQEHIAWDIGALALAEQQRAYFADRPLAADQQAVFAQMSASSLQAQALLEADQQLSFDQYLENYYAQYRGCGCST